MIYSPSEERLSTFLVDEGKPSTDEGTMPLGETVCDTAILWIKELRAKIKELEEQL